MVNRSLVGGGRHFLSKFAGLRFLWGFFFVFISVVSVAQPPSSNSPALNNDVPLNYVVQQGDTLWWGSGYFSAIENAYGDVKMIIRGYDRRHEGLAMNQWTATVDAGCGFGGRLAAACFLPDGSATEWIEI